MSGNSRRARGFFVFVALFLVTPVASGASIVHVDFGPGWVTNLGTLMTGIGADPIIVPELGDLETTIMGELERIFIVEAGLDIMFVPSPPPPSATNIIDFTKDELTSEILMSPPGLPKGVADSDWLNRQFFPPPRTYQKAEVFPQEFDDIVDEWTGSTAGTRSGMIGELATALAGTAAHELGHTYGARHHDAYGDPGIGPAGPFGPMGEYIIVGTGGLQNSHIMATGSTGIGEADRESMRTLSRYTISKFEIASDPAVTPESLTTIPFDHTEEVPFSHDSIPLAQPLDSAFMPKSGLSVANVHGASLGDIDDGGTGTDFYVIELLEGGLVTAEVLSREVYGPSLETTLTIYDGTGTVIFASDDLDYSATMMFFTTSVPFGDPEGKQDDPAVLQMDLLAGTYFFEVAIDGDGDHSPGDPATDELFYDLYVTAEGSFSMIPEPAALTLLLPLFGWALLRRRND